MHVQYIRQEPHWTALLALIKAEIELKQRNKYSELIQFRQSAQSVCKIVKTVPKKAPFLLPNHSYLRTGIKL